jgi:ATP-dependent RNA helicase DDX27
VDELHGNLTQAQRLESLENFKAGNSDFLIATDLAGRGLDVQGIDVVINFEVPRNVSEYVHRVGRTARAGRKGRAVTLADDSGRYFQPWT